MELGPEANKLRGFQKGTCQHQVPHSRMSSPEGLLLASVSPRVSSNCFLHLQETLQISLGLTLSNPMDCSLPGSSIHGIFQARVLEWGAIAFSKSNPCWPSKPNILGHILLGQDPPPQDGEPDVGAQIPHSLGRTLQL